MEVDWKGLARTRRVMGDEGTTLLLLKTREADRAALDAALAQTGEETPANGDWSRQQHGWTLLLEGLDDEVAAFVEDLARALSERGVDGTLTGASAARPPAWARDLQVRGSLTARVGLTAPEPPGPGRWCVGDAGTTLAAELAAGWVSWDGATPVMCRTPSGVGFWADPRAAGRYLPQQTVSNGMPLLSGWNRERDEARNGSTVVPACLDLSTNRRGRPWEAMVDELRDLLLSLPLEAVSAAAISHRDLGTLLNSSGPDSGYSDRIGYSLRPDLWNEVVLEPCGIQILTERHLARAHDLTDWDTTRLDDHHVLVQARDLKPWFAPPRAPHEPLDADLLDRARHDFGSMILQPGDLEEGLGG